MSQASVNIDQLRQNMMRAGEFRWTFGYQHKSPTELVMLSQRKARARVTHPRKRNRA
jgi:hypothetical protein